MRRRRLEKPDENKENHFKRAYGITLKERYDMLASQNFLCAICSTDVRGILCRHCNLLLGYARDNPSTLSAAIAYLGK